MTTYLSPGVYVEEIASGSAPIVGVGTSIAAFIGTIKAQSATQATDKTNNSTATSNQIKLTVSSYVVEEDAQNSIEIPLDQIDVKPKNIDFSSVQTQYLDNQSSLTVTGSGGHQKNDIQLTNAFTQNNNLSLTFSNSIPINATINGNVTFQITPTSNSLTTDNHTISSYKLKQVEGEKVGTGDGNTTTFDLSNYPVLNSDFAVKVDGEDKTGDVSLTNDDEAKKSRIKFTTTTPESGKTIIVDYYPQSASKEIKLCTNFSEFKKFFGDFEQPSGDTQGQNTLAHAVYGFFRNGGTRCYVTWITGKDEVNSVTEKFEAIDEITIVAAPGNLDLRDDIKDHCEKMGDRIAVLDSEEEIDLSNTDAFATLYSDYAALYFPWIQVYDPASDKNIYIPPSGHIAGIYARVDGQRGVHKAPANETILGALDLKYNLSKAHQDRLNPDGINCIRKLNGGIRVWGARTLGGDDNGEFKYVNIRRQFCYLRESIEKGTQWTVFEPNDHELWAKIRRNISAFLTTEWRNGALFGTTPQEAFYVKCDEETNPPEVRDLGQVITEIGVAVIKPAEFVIFRLSQWSGSGQ